MIRQAIRVWLASITPRVNTKLPSNNMRMLFHEKQTRREKARAYAGRASAYADIGRFQEASDDLNRAIKNHSRDTNSLLEPCVCL